MDSRISFSAFLAEGRESTTSWHVMEQWRPPVLHVRQYLDPQLNPVLQLLMGITMMTVISTSLTAVVLCVLICSRRTHPPTTRMGRTTPLEHGFEEGHPAQQAGTMSAEETVFENNLPKKVYGSREPAPPTNTGRSNVYSTSSRSNVYDLPENLPQNTMKNRRPVWKTGVLRPQSESNQDDAKEIPRAPEEAPEEPSRRKNISPLTRIGVIIECVNNHPDRVMPGSNIHAVWVTCKECGHHYTWRLKGRAPPFDLVPNVEVKLRDLWTKQCDAAGRPHA